MAEGDVVIDFAANTDEAVKAIEKISSALVGLKNSTKGGFGGVNKAAESIKTVCNAASGLSGKADSLKSLASSLESIKSAAKGLRTASVASGLKSIGQSLDALGTSDGKMRSIAASLREFEGIKITRSAFNGLSRIPEIVKSFEAMDTAKLTSELNKLSAALGPFAGKVRLLAEEWAKLPPCFRTVASAARSVSAANRQLNRTSKSAADGMNHEGRAARGLSTNLRLAHGSSTSLSTVINGGTLLLGLHALAEGFSTAISKVNEYIEAMNLAQTVMGGEQFQKMAGDLNGIEFGSTYDINTKQGNGFWPKAQELMGIDAGEAIKYQVHGRLLVHGGRYRRYRGRDRRRGRLRERRCGSCQRVAQAAHGLR